MNRRMTGRNGARGVTRHESVAAETFSSSHESIITSSFGTALLNSFFRELKNAYFEGGLDCVDATLDGINGYLSQLGAEYWLGPGGVVEQDEDGNASALGIPFCDPDKGDVLTTLWIMLAEPQQKHSCPKCSS